MKKLLLGLAFGLFAITSYGQCTDLFISEYFEGSGNNKGVEIYNPTTAPISLNGWTLERYSNGATTSAAGGVKDLSGFTVPAGGVMVLVNGQTTFENGGTSPPCDSVLQAMADILDDPYPAPTYFNGNDALVLFKSNSTVIVDIFGKVGQDPGQGWTDDATAGYTDANGGTWWTKDQTLRRKYSVGGGETNPALSEFNPTLEYDSFPNNTWDGIGMHDCMCAVAVEETAVVEKEGVYLYPSLLDESGQTVMLGSSGIKRVEIFDLTGKKVLDISNQGFTQRVEINIPDQRAGIYLVRATMDTGSVLTKKIVKR